MSTVDSSPILNARAVDTPRGGDAAPAADDAASPAITILSCTSAGDTLHLAVAGEADHFNTGPLRAILASAAADGYRRLILDSSRITFADSGFLAALAPWCCAGLALRHHRPSAAVQRLLAAAPPEPPPPLRRAATGLGKQPSWPM